MFAFKNGFVPLDMFVVVGEGHNDVDGHWTHWLTPATAGRWEALRKRAHARTGRWLIISPGFGGYRPYDKQVASREYWARLGQPLMSAEPGYSSHGMLWEGRTVLAIDVGNWAAVYGGDRQAFFADCRAEGFEPGMIHPSRKSSYPDEPHHIIDPNPLSEGLEYMDEKQVKKIFIEALDEYFIVRKLGPGERNFWDSLKFVAGMVGQGTVAAVKLAKKEGIK